jgi:hypothetical protein
MRARPRKEWPAPTANGHPFDRRRDRDARGFSRPNDRVEAPACLIRSEMLLILLSAAWLATTLLIVGICRMAARGDAQPASVDHRYPSEGLPIWDDPRELALPDTRQRAAGGRVTAPGDRS